MRSILIALSLVATLAGCATKPVNDSPPEVIAASAYRDPSAPSLTLMTVVSNRSGSGGHSALVVNASQQVIFDPAGSYKHPRVPEKGDVLYGVSPAILQSYKGAHARSTYHVVSQTVPVTAEQAEIALRLVRGYGNVGDARCAQATTDILAQVPGFQGIKSTWFPANLMEQFATLPGVVTDKYYENDEGDILDGVAKIQL
ncbi:hypothetical protein [Pseudosulfitobacter sp. DSM 107133]|jgi:hypothetical protein|uniref:hypothetical protein n=1 Tax=Pseudosulfitobacter sp. DSM 107133 TaxID=2883100 RepID=UPI000DF22AAF|nr:hypothetical protein [Pseudosulfitobacter sp. DSM 107133]UOA28139.1 hypothetical protein DSM107133_02884 [Pseudosulfitobacter sp. DSM 107133]